MTKYQQTLAAVLLFTINLLNYMDRYAVAGLLTYVQPYYRINDTWGGLLQSVFIVLFLVCTGLSGFLGDRYSRKWIMISGLSVWVIAVSASSFIPPQYFWLFFLLRGVVGVGEGSYSCLAPTFIADLFASGTQRSRALMLYYFAIPVGAGLGYVCGSFLSSMLNDWRWGLRVTPPIGAICVLTLAVLVKEPERGQAEQQEAQEEEETSKGEAEVKEKLSKEVVVNNNNKEGPQAICGHPHSQEDTNRLYVTTPKNSSYASSYWADVRYLASIPTYYFLISGYTATFFVGATYAWWAPAAVFHAQAMKAGLNVTSALSKSEYDTLALTFGGVTLFSGFLGTALGTFWAEAWKKGRWCFSRCQTPCAPLLISAIGSLAVPPLLFLGFHLLGQSITLLPMWCAFFLARVALYLNRAVNVDVLLDIVVPARRSVANSWLIVASHLFGDAAGPWILGAISDALRRGDISPSVHYHSLARAFYITNMVLIFSGLAFLCGMRTLGRDMFRCKELMKDQWKLRVATTNCGNRVSPSDVSKAA